MSSEQQEEIQPGAYYFTMDPGDIPAWQGAGLYRETAEGQWELITHYPSLITRKAIIAAANKFVDVPFRHQGRDAEFGLDCRGLLFAISSALGHTPRHQHRDNYQVNPDPKEFRAGLENELEETPVADALPGDVLLLRELRQQPGEETHVGVLVPGDYELMLIHATWFNERVVKEPLRPGHRRLASAAFRFPGLANCCLLTADCLNHG